MAYVQAAVKYILEKKEIVENQSVINVLLGRTSSRV
jgi:hypothetical protein